MLILSTEKIPGREVPETLGIARGSTVRARNTCSDINEFQNFNFTVCKRRSNLIPLPFYFFIILFISTFFIINIFYNIPGVAIYMLIGLIVLILIIYVIVNRIEEKKKERFEKRDF